MKHEALFHIELITRKAMTKLATVDCYNVCCQVDALQSGRNYQYFMEVFQLILI